MFCFLNGKTIRTVVNEEEKDQRSFEKDLAHLFTEATGTKPIFRKRNSHRTLF